MADARERFVRTDHYEHIARTKRRFGIQRYNNFLAAADGDHGNAEPVAVRLAYVLKQADLERAMDLLALGIKKYNALKK